MTVTLEEAQADLPAIVAKAATGEDVFIAAGSGHPAVKLVAVAANGSRLAQDAQVKGGLTILDHEALVKPLPPEEWGELARR
jgi:antitoxin (DNA-binding transcriptional repressor) of toxin-antitoxin stability system